MRQPEMLKADGDGIEIQLAQWPGDGPPVLCIHGLTANCRSFDTIAGALSPAHRVIAMDLRGRGRSDKPATGYSMNHHCRDIKAVLDSLGLDKVSLLGHSLGSYISLAYTAANPDQVQKLALLDGGANLTPEQWGKVTLGIKPSLDRLGKLFPSFEAYTDTVKASPFMKPWNEAMESYYAYDTEQIDGQTRSVIHPENIDEERANLLTMDPSAYYPMIKCPVLILRATLGMLGGDELVLPQSATDGLLAQLPTAKLVNLDGMHHFSVAFQPCPQLDQALLDFF